MIRKFLIAALALIPSFGAIAQTEIAKGDVNLMVVSDLGRNGHYDQDRKSTRLNSSHGS